MCSAAPPPICSPAAMKAVDLSAKGTPPLASAVTAAVVAMVTQLAMATAPLRVAALAAGIWKLWGKNYITITFLPTTRVPSCDFDPFVFHWCESGFNVTLAPAILPLLFFFFNSTFFHQLTPSVSPLIVYGLLHPQCPRMDLISQIHFVVILDVILDPIP